MSFWPQRMSMRLVPLKYACVLNPETLPETTDPDFEMEYVDIGSVSLEKGIKSREPLRFGQSPSRARKPIRNGDVIIATVRTYLKAITLVEGASSNWVASTGFAVCRPAKGVIPEYLYRVMQSNSFVESVVASSTGVSYPAINPSTLGKLPIPLPDLPTQQAIADFLDRETARIDQLIEKKGRLITLLEEKKRALVDLLVTGGLSENPSRKPVNVSWLSDIPSHWAALPIKKLLVMPITDGPHETPEFVDDGVIFISAESIKNGEIDFDRKRGYITPEANEVYSRKYSPQFGDIYIIKSGATTGKSAMVRDFVDFNIWSPLAVLRSARSTNSEFLLLVVRSTSFQDAIALNWSWGTQQNIGMGVLGQIVVPVPPIEEQDRIVQHFKEEAAQARKIEVLATRSIERLRELRFALITASVTGQIDVATWSKGGETHRRLEAIERDMEAEREVAAV